MRRNLAFLFGALALPLALACGGASSPTATDPVIEDISDADVLATSGMPGLTEEQRAALQAAFAAARAQLTELRARYAAGEVTAAEAEAIARRIHEELLAAIRSILTPEQLGRLPHPPGLPGRPGPPPGPPPDLGLTEEQVAQLTALRQEMMEFVRELQAKVASGEITAEEAREALRAKAQENFRRACAILTPEQQAQVPFCTAG